MSHESPHGDYYGYDALPNWQGVIRYYGALVEKPEWVSLRPLFDLVKQMGTAGFSASFEPSIVDDVFYLSREPLGKNPTSQSRLSIGMENADEVSFKLYAAGSDEPRTLTTSRGDVLHWLTKILGEL